MSKDEWVPFSSDFPDLFLEPQPPGATDSINGIQCIAVNTGELLTNALLSNTAKMISGGLQHHDYSQQTKSNTSIMVNDFTNKKKCNVSNFPIPVWQHLPTFL